MRRGEGLYIVCTTQLVLTTLQASIRCLLSAFVDAGEKTAVSGI